MLLNKITNNIIIFWKHAAKQYDAYICGKYKTLSTKLMNGYCHAQMRVYAKVCKIQQMLIWLNMHAYKNELPIKIPYSFVTREKQLINHKKCKKKYLRCREVYNWYYVTTQLYCYTYTFWYVYYRLWHYIKFSVWILFSNRYIKCIYTH